MTPKRPPPPPAPADPLRTGWIAGLAEAVRALRTPAFLTGLERALAFLAPFQMMNGFVYSPDGRAFDLYNEKIAAERSVIVDRYLAGAFVLDPFYDAILADRRERLLVMRRLAPDDFAATEYFRQHYATTRIVDEIGFVIQLERDFVAVLSLSRTGVAPLFFEAEIARFEEIAPLVAALAGKHWQGVPDAMLDLEGSRPAVRIEHPLLTKRELEIVTLILKGHSNLSLSGVLSLSPNTVKVHRRQIYAKLRISSQAELFALFLS